MGKVFNGVWKKAMVFLLVMSFVFSGAGLNAQAAANKALCVKFSFNGQNYEDSDYWYNNSYSIVMTGTSKKTALKDLAVSAEFYIPKTALKKGANIDFLPYADVLDTKGNYVGIMTVKIGISVVNENGKIELNTWNNQTGKAVKPSKYISCKAGTGKYKSYYVISLTNVPLINRIEKDNGKKITVKASTKYAFNIGCSVCGVNSKASGKFYMDNVQASAGKKRIVNITFSSKPEFYACFNKDKELGKKKVSIVAF